MDNKPNTPSNYGYLDTTGVDLSLSMNIVDENLDDAEDIEIL